MSDIRVHDVKFTGDIVCGNCRHHITESNAATCIEVAGVYALLVVCPSCGQEHQLSLPKPKLVPPSKG